MQEYSHPVCWPGTGWGPVRGGGGGLDLIARAKTPPRIPGRRNLQRQLFPCFLSFLGPPSPPSSLEIPPNLSSKRMPVPKQESRILRSCGGEGGECFLLKEVGRRREAEISGGTNQALRVGRTPPPLPDAGQRSGLYFLHPDTISGAFPGTEHGNVFRNGWAGS